MTNQVPAAETAAAGMKVRPDYRVAVVLDGAPLPPPSVAVNTVTITPASPEPEDMAEALTVAGLSAADVRSRTLLVAAADGTEAASARVVSAMAALWGLSRHRCDVALTSSDVTVPAAEVDGAYRSLPDLGRPVERPTLVTASVDSEEPLAGCPHVALGPDLSAEQVTLLRYAKRVLWVPSADAGLDVLAVVALAAVRARGEQDRLPAMWLERTEWLPGQEESGMPGRIVDLGMVRRAAEGVRAATRTDDRGALAPPEPLTDRQVFLAAMAATPLERVLEKLGVVSAVSVDEETGLPETVWHCPHPEKHTHGDATPSARLEVAEDGSVGFRCMRCLPERVDALSLVMWAKGLPVDDAAGWLADHAVNPELG